MIPFADLVIQHARIRAELEPVNDDLERAYAELSGIVKEVMRKPDV